MRCVGWVRALGVAAAVLAPAVLAGALGAVAQVDEQVDQHFDDRAFGDAQLGDARLSTARLDHSRSDSPGFRHGLTTASLGADEASLFDSSGTEADDFASGDFASPDPSGTLDPYGADDAALIGSLLFPELSQPTAAASADPLSGGFTADQVVLFGGADVWRNGVSNYAGLHGAANGLNDDGFILRLTMSNSLERYRTSTRTYTTNIFRATLMPGWRFKRGEFELKLFAGPDFGSQTLTPDNVKAKWRGPHAGFRVAAETWSQPVPELMPATSFYLTTIAEGYGFRAAAGWRLLDAFWLGPEWSGSRDEFSRQTRVGVHLTGLQSGALEWSAAVGYVSDSFGRSGSYGRLATQLRP